MNSKLTAEGIMGAAMRMGAELSGGEFSISVFPHKIQRIITELHASQGYPIDYIAAAMLSALAVSIGNSHLVQVKRGWLESPILYMALIGRPGANKSHPLSFAFQPFIEHDYHHNKEYQEQYAEYERTMAMTKKERLESGKDEFPIPPKRNRFLVSDITPEGLSLIHTQNPRGLCLWSDELSAWFKLNRRTGEAERVKFICNEYKFSGSKIDRQFSFINIACRLEENAFDAGIYPRRNSTPTAQREEPSEESSLSVGLLDLATAPATDPEEEMLTKQYVKKKKKPQRKRGFRL